MSHLHVLYLLSLSSYVVSDSVSAYVQHHLTSVGAMTAAVKTFIRNIDHALPTSQTIVDVPAQ